MQATPATTHPTGTLAKDFVAFYLTEVATLASSAKVLHGLFVRRKNGAERDAIWEGSWALQMKAQEYTRTLRDHGGLLFVGSPVALEAARQLRAAQ